MMNKEMKYYEVDLYEYNNDERYYNWYLKNQGELTDEQVKAVLIRDFLGKGLSQEDINNITAIREITGDEFTTCSGISA